MADDVRLLTYDEIASTFRITRESARQLVIRKRWGRQKGNDGKARIEVPEEAIGTSDDPSHDTCDTTGADTSHDPSDDPSDATAFLAATAVLTRHIERLEGELKETKAALEAERVRASQLISLKATLEAEQKRSLELQEERDLERSRAVQVESLKAILEAEKCRAGELKEERDRWQTLATAPRGLWGWLRKAS